MSADRRAQLRVAIIGAAHWHFPNYAKALLELPTVRIVGVADPDTDVARRRALEVGTTWTTDYREICVPGKVDFAVALGRHCDMAEQGQHLIDAGIPFAMEKPCGLNAAEVGALARLARENGSFVAVPLVWRQSDFISFVAETAAGDRFEYLSLRIVSGHPDRYPQSGNPWMLDPALAGGGSTVNLGVHLIDLFRVLAGGAAVEVESASMSNAAFGLPIEDWSALVLRAGSARCVAESGFLFPAPTGRYDMRFTIKTDRHYILADPESTVVLDPAGGRVEARTLAANEPTYRAFVHDTLDRYRRDVPPIADLEDMEIVMRAVDRAYALAPLETPSDRPTPRWEP